MTVCMVSHDACRFVCHCVVSASHAYSNSRDCLLSSMRVVFANASVVISVFHDALAPCFCDVPCLGVCWLAFIRSVQFLVNLKLDLVVPSCCVEQVSCIGLPTCLFELAF